MSGRGRGSYRGRGRYGRGNNRTHKTNFNGTNKKTTTSNLYDLNSASKSTNNFEEVNRNVLTNIRKVYGTLVHQALVDRKHIDFNDSKLKPQRQTSTATDPDTKASEEAEYDTDFKAAIAQYAKDKAAYNDKMGKVIAVLWSQCTRELQIKIEERADYMTHIKDDAIAPMNAIEEHAMGYDKSKLKLEIIGDAIRNLFMIRQKEEEELISYYERFTSATKPLTKHFGGQINIISLIDDMKKKNPTMNEKDIQIEEWNRFLAFYFIERSDHDKYGVFIEGLKSQETMGHTQFPKTIEEARAILSARTFEDKYKEKLSKKKSSANNKSQSNQEFKTDHTSVMSEITLAQTEGVCYCCGKKGHLSSKCRFKDKPKSEWHMNKAKEIQNLMKHASENTTAESETIVELPAQTTQQSSGNSVASSYNDIYQWAIQHLQVGAVADTTTQVSMSQVQEPLDLRKVLLLDNQSTCHHLCNPDFAANIREVLQTLLLQSSGGTTKTNFQSDLLPEIIPKVKTWFDINGMANIISFALIREQHNVTYDPVRDVFLIDTGEKILDFKKSPEGLYYYKPEITKKTTLLQSVEENKSFYSNQQLERAKRARELLHTLGFPSVADLKRIIKMNSIKDCPVTVDDINLAEKIYGPDVATIKGKATRTRPIPVVNDIIEIPKELIAAQHDVEMSIDTLFVNSMPFLATISHNIKYRTCNFVPSRRMMDYRSVLAKVVLLYTNAGFTIKMIHADSEYRAVLEYFKNSSNKIDYNLATANEHVPQAERNIRTIKERVRATYHSLPFKAIPKLFIKELMAETANKLNFFPPKNGVSEYYSPREILSHQRLDYTKNCTIPQFSYVQAYDEPEPRNSQAARSLDCIYLRPVNNLQGGHVLYHFGTKGTITRRKVKVIPITASVIEAVERLAKADGIKSLVLHNKDGTIFYDSSWIAGVDHTQNEDYDNIYDDSDYESSGSETDVDLEPDYDAEQDNYDEHGDSQENSIQEELSYADQSIDDEDIDEEGDGIDQLDLIFQENNEDEEEEAQNEETEHDAISEGSLRRSSRQSHVSDRLQSYREQTGKNYSQRHYEVLNYDLQDARVIAMIMLYQRDNTYAIEYANVTTYSLKTAIKKFGMRATKAAHKEMKQLHDRDCWEPIHPKDLKDIEMKRALRTIFFITQKSNGDIKGRTCADGSVQRNWIGRDEVSSPTVSTESIILTGMIEAHEKRDVGTCDIPNAFVQTHLDKHDKDGNRTIMKLEGPLVQILCEIDPTYTKYLIKVKGQKVLYVHLIKALYGMLVSAMLFCKKLKQDLIEYGFEINPYDPCVANKMVNGKQLTVTWHVDDLKVSHIQPSVVTEFMQWVKTMYGKIGEVKITRGKVHEYLGMKLIYNSNGSLTIDMSDYIQSMIDTFPSKELEGKSVSSPWDDNLFKVTKGSNKLEKKKAEQFHTTTAQGLFACKRARPDINPVIAFLTTRVKEPTQEDWMKLVCMMKYLLKTKLDSLTLKLSNDMIIKKWYVDAAFAVHPDMKSQTGFTAILGQGAPICTSRKQILNTRSSTEAELVGADDAAGPMLWTMRFMHSQGYKIKTVLYQDNKAAILMETNGRASAGKRSRHIDIRYFFIYDMN